VKKPIIGADLGAPTLTMVTDTTGKVIRIETVLADGSPRVLYPLTPDQIEEFERFLTAPPGLQ
jgi:hypothetical protein